MKILKTFLVSLVLFVTVLFSYLIYSTIQNVQENQSVGLTVCNPYQGCTGIGTASSSDIGKAVVVTDDSPFTYGLQTVSSTGSSSSTILQTNGTPNGSQALLNLKNGTNVTISDDGVGGVTINSSGTGGGSTTTLTNTLVAFGNAQNQITSSTNLSFTTSTNVFQVIGTVSSSNALFINASSTNLFASGLSYTNANGTSITSTNGNFTGLSFTTGSGGTLTLTSITSTNGNIPTFTFTTAVGTSVTSTNGNHTTFTFGTAVGTSVTTTNLAVTGALTLPANSVTDAMVVAGLTISGGSIDNSPIGASTPSTGAFTNATSTNFFSTGLSFTNLSGANITSTANFSFVSAVGTSITSTNISFTRLQGTGVTTTNLAVTGLTNLASTIITNGTSTNFFSTGLSFTNLNGTNATTTNLNWTTGTGNTLVLTSGTSTNFTALTGLVIPVGSNPTIAAAGSLGTDNTSGQLKYSQDGSTVNVLVPYKYVSFFYATTTAWSGTTTLYLGPADVAETWVRVKCETNTGTLNVQYYDGTNRMNVVTASTTIGAVTLSTNNTFTASESRRVDIGTPASSPTSISCKAMYTITAD